MEKECGFYKSFEKCCAKYYNKQAVIHHIKDQYKEYKYSELFGICLCVANTLKTLQYQGSTETGKHVGLLMKQNPLVISIVAAVHKSSMPFIFLDPDNLTFLQSISKVSLAILISVRHAETDRLTCNEYNDFTEEKCEVYYDFSVTYYKSCNMHHDALKQPKCSYSVLTSGSTGKPKIIHVTNKSLLPNIKDFTNIFEIKSTDIIYFSTPLTFDPSIVEMYLAIRNGASLLIASDNAEILFSSKKSKYNVTVWQTTPSKFGQQSDRDISEYILNANSKLRVLALGGEPLHIRNVTRLKSLKSPLNKSRLFTLYGLTEMSCWACYTEINLNDAQPCGEIPIGRCLSETKMKVSRIDESSPYGNIFLGSCTRKCVIISNDGVESTNITSENATFQDMIWIDTGDRAEIKNNKIFYRGRVDDVVKRFGIKVDLRTIENASMKCPGVDSNCCVWLSEQQLLILFYTSISGISSQTINIFLKQKSDHSHQPDHIIKVDELPLSAHGKIYKSSLKNYFISMQSHLINNNLYLEREELFIDEIKGMLSLQKSANCKDFVKNSFFVLGGSSFLARMLVNKMQHISSKKSEELLQHLLDPTTSIEKCLSILKLDSSDEKRMHGMTNVGKRKLFTKKNTSTMKRSTLPSMDKLSVNIIWQHDTGKCVDASPVLEDSVLIVGSHSGKILVIDALSGEIKGSLQVSSRIEAPVAVVTEGGRKLGCVGTYNGTVVCFNLAGCEIVWETHLNAMVKSKAVLVKGDVFVAAYDGYIHCINLEAGTQLRKLQVSRQGVTADLTLAMDTFIYYGSLDGAVGCFDTNTFTVTWQISVSSPIFAQPKTFRNNVCLLVVEVMGIVHCLDSRTGVEMWNFDSVQGNIFSSIHVQTRKTGWQITFGCHDNHLYSLGVNSANEIQLKWKVELSEKIYATPCCFDEKNIIAISTDGSLQIVNLKSGNVIHHYNLPGEIFSSPCVLNDCVYVGCRDDYIYCLRIKL